jgi:hypothetical protein
MDEKNKPESPESRFQKFLKQRSHAILDESGNVIPASLLEWATWFETNDKQRIIQQDYFLDDKFKVSTVFLGTNHNYFSSDKPLWFETMVFGPKKKKVLLGKMHEVRPDLWMRRCETLAQAKAQHQEGINWLKVTHLVAQ